MCLRELRTREKLTQAECAAYLGIPLRTYQLYEADEGRCPPIKYRFILQKMEEYGFVDEEHGILKQEEIRERVSRVLSEYGAEYCYLFGSYARGRATEESDVDLLVATDIGGLRFYELAEALREALHKKVDLLKPEQLRENLMLLSEILKDGVKIYG